MDGDLTTDNKSLYYSSRLYHCDVTI